LRGDLGGEKTHPFIANTMIACAGHHDLSIQSNVYCPENPGQPSTDIFQYP
jgi:hypothetical protein